MCQSFPQGHIDFRGYRKNSRQSQLVYRQMVPVNTRRICVAYTQSCFSPCRKFFCCTKPSNSNLQSPRVDDLESSVSVCNYAPSILLPGLAFVTSFTAFATFDQNAIKQFFLLLPLFLALLKDRKKSFPCCDIFRQRKTTKIVDIEKTNVKLSRKLLLNFRTKTDKTQFLMPHYDEESNLNIIYSSNNIKIPPTLPLSTLHPHTNLSF